jgi:hypothetical protein
MQTAEKHKPTQMPAEPRFTRETPQEQAPPIVKRSFIWGFMGALVVALMLIVGIMSPP